MVAQPARQHPRAVTKRLYRGRVVENGRRDEEHDGHAEAIQRERDCEARLRATGQALVLVGDDLVHLDNRIQNEVEQQLQHEGAVALRRAHAVAQALARREVGDRHARRAAARHAVGAHETRQRADEKVHNAEQRACDGVQRGGAHRPWTRAPVRRVRARVFDAAATTRGRRRLARGPQHVLAQPAQLEAARVLEENPERVEEHEDGEAERHAAGNGEGEQHGANLVRAVDGERARDDARCRALPR